MEYQFIVLVSNSYKLVAKPSLQEPSFYFLFFFKKKTRENKNKKTVPTILTVKKKNGHVKRDNN